VKLRYTRRAAAELEEVLAYIEERSPRGARRVQAITNLLLEASKNWPSHEQRPLETNGRLSLSVSDFLRSD